MTNTTKSTSTTNSGTNAPTTTTATLLSTRRSPGPRLERHSSTTFSRCPLSSTRGSCASPQPPSHSENYIKRDCSHPMLLHPGVSHHLVRLRRARERYHSSPRSESTSFSLFSSSLLLLHKGIILDLAWELLLHEIGFLHHHFEKMVEAHYVFKKILFPEQKHFA